MNKDWQYSQLGKLDTGDSIFKYIPDAIGEILYCDTNEPREEPLSPKEVKNKKITGVTFCLISLSLYWGFLYEHYIWGIFITICILLVTLGICNTDFEGTDFFIGKNGFSIVRFNKKRDNIVEVKNILFSNISYLFTGETIVKINYSYSRTDYYFTLYDILDKNNMHHVAYTLAGSYSDKSPKDPMNPDGADEEYCFMKMVERIWTLYFFNVHKNEEFLSFPILLKGNSLYTNAIVFGRNYIDVRGVRYNHENTKRIYFSNGQLTIEHLNHSKKYFGLVEKGNINTIPLSDLGNRMAFLMLFENLYKG